VIIRRIALGATAAALAAAVALLGGLFSDPASSVAPRTPPPDVAAGQLLAGFSPDDTALYVRDLEQRVAGAADDSESLLLLGLAYQQRARETGDPSFYPRSEEALQRARTLLERRDPRGRKFLVVTGLGALAASRHRFHEARDLAREAVRLSPASAAPYGVLADALVELGRYRAGFRAIERMVGLKPSLASYARVSYSRELLGRPKSAIEAMSYAVEAGAANAEHAAWTSVELGNLFFSTGRLGPAERAYRQALARLPGYVHAEAGLARVAAAGARYRQAIRLYRRAVAELPLPEHAIALADTLRAAGRVAEARRAYSVVDGIGQLYRANGARTELETALFDFDQGRRVGDALARARTAYRLAPSIHAADVLAWGLYRNERCTEARTYSREALRLGTLDALKLFHRGMIERCLGNREAARRFLGRALAVNPYFSLQWVPVAERALS
jgi:tetratricopeptide (TPR) repeat protein